MTVFEKVALKEGACADTVEKEIGRALEIAAKSAAPQNKQNITKIFAGQTIPAPEKAIKLITLYIMQTMSIR